MNQKELRQVRKKESDEKILKSALKVFGQKGYNDALLTEIASGAGVSQSLVSQRYISKENLLLETVKVAVEKMMEEIGNDESFPDIFFNVIRFLKNSAENEKDIFSFISTYATTINNPHCVQEYIINHFENSVFKKVIIKAQKDGKLYKNNPFDLFYGFFKYSIALIECHTKNSIPIPDDSHFLTALNIKLDESNTIKAVDEKDINTKPLKETADKVKIVSKAKTNFLFNISNIIRSPMYSINEFIDLAKKNIDNKEKVLEYLDSIKKVEDKLLSVTNEIINISAVDNAQGKSLLENVDIVAECNDCKIIAESMAKQNEIVLKYSNEVRNRFVYANCAYIKKCMFALLSNAIQFSSKGSVVKASIFQDEVTADGFGVFKFIVKDYGCGISEEFIGKVFEPFEVETNNLAKANGIGLGLFTTKKLVESMNGTIEVESQKGEGSTFTITIPLLIYDNSAEKESVYIENTVAKKILLVDDNELNRAITKDFLEDKGFFVDEATDGYYAVNKFMEKGPEYYSVILMDIHMPIMNGCEATKKIRSMYPRYRIPIIAMSSKILDDDLRKIHEVGMDAYISKPIKIEALYEAIIRSMESTMKTDSLTKVKNRFAYEETEQIVNEAISKKEINPFAIVMCDINNLKDENDKHGHEAGDKLILSATKIICYTFKHSPVFRIGGDELVVFLEGEDYENRNLLLSQFREQILNNVTNKGVVVASGMSEYTKEDRYMLDVFIRADQEMYANKKQLKAM